MKLSPFFALFACLIFSLSTNAGGTWVPLVNSPPGDAGHFMLLSDGSVIAEDLSTNFGPGWFRLKPDIHGSYVNGTWSTIAPMNNTRLDFSSDVLTNGNVFVASGEYGTGTTNAEIYNPVNNSWTDLVIPAGIITTDNVPYSDTQNSAGFSDCGSILLSDGRVLLSPVFPATSGNTATYDPAANTWTNAALVRGYDEDEASWVKLPDDSILVIDSSWPAGIPSTNSERYVPALNTWVNDSNLPVSLYDSYGLELGPAMLLPNGRAIFFGATSHTAIYTPSGTTNAGSWAAGPDFPNSQGMPDSPCAMLVNGNVLCAVEHAATNSTEWYPPVSFYEYNYLNNNFTQVTAPGGGTYFNDECWPTLMLALPDGTVLFGHRGTDFYVYQPDGVPLAAAKPVINSISTNSDGSLLLTGTLFNGLCQGAAYGDDEQMDSNFPLVRFTDANGNVRYGRTYNWSRSSVQTGSAVVTTRCTVPAGVSLTNTVQVVVNGIASAGVPFILPAAGYWVTNTADSGPGSLRLAIANSISGDIINFSPNLAGLTITLTSGELLLSQSLTIDASTLPGGIVLDGNQNGRIFDVSPGATVELISLTITNGFAGTGNSGGAIVNNGSLNITNCTLAGNSTDDNDNGGAIYNNGALRLTACTLAANSANFGGAIQNYNINCALVNCTLAGNLADINGGAIDSDFSAVLALTHCTFYGNAAGVGGSGSGGAVDNYLSTVYVTNSILAGNSAPNGPDIYNWASSTVTMGGTNLMPALVNNGMVNGPGSVITSDPLLATLGNYGGPTQTMPPLPGSPAIDSAAATTLSTDQRGFPRLLGLGPDIGAVEGVYNASGPGWLTGATVLGNVSFQFGFTNYTDMSFTVLATTNLTLPLNLWSNLGAALESPVGSGQFQFSDLLATNHSQRFYCIHSP